MAPAGDSIVEARARVARLPWRHPRRIGLLLLEIGVVLLVVALPFKQQIKYACLAVALVGAVLAALPLHRLPGFWWAAWFGVLQVVTEIRQPYDLHLGGMVYSWLAVYLAVPVLLGERTRRLALQGLLVSLAVAVGLAATQFALGYTKDEKPLLLATYGERLVRAGAFHGPVTFASLMVGIYLCFLTAATERDVGRRGRLEALALSLGGVFISGTRMAYLAILGATGAWAAARGRRGRLLLLILPVIAIAAVLLFYWQHPARCRALLDGKDGRLEIWATGWRAICRQPWLGSGSGDGFRLAYLAAQDPTQPAEFGWGYFNLHSSYLTIWAQHGLVTLVAYLGWLGALGWNLLRRHRPGGRAWPLGAGLLVATLLIGCFDHFAGRASYHLAVYVGLGLALVMGIEEGGEGTAGLAA